MPPEQLAINYNIIFKLVGAKLPQIFGLGAIALIRPSQVMPMVLHFHI